MGNSVKLHLKSKDPAAFGLLWDVFPPVIQRSLREDVDFMNFCHFVVDEIQAASSICGLTISCGTACSFAGYQI